MSESTRTSSPESPKRTRRTLTPEQRIAERKAEIERIEEQRRQKVRDLIAEACDTLRDARSRAGEAGMTAEVEVIGEALKLLPQKA